MSFIKLKRFLIDGILLPAVGIGFVTLFWCILSALTYDREAQMSDFPSPIATWNDSFKYFVNPFSSNTEEGFDGIGLETWRSLKLVGMGYGMAILAAVPIGFLLGGSRNFARMFDPIFQVLRPISPLAWFPLAGLIVIAIRRHNQEIDATQLQCIFTIAMCSIWPTILNTAVGVRAIPQDYLNVGKVLRLSPLKLFTRILLPATIPYMFTGFRLSLGIAWLVIVAAEMLSGKNGIGAFVNNQYQSGTYGPMIAAVIVIGVVGFMLDRVMNLIEKNSMVLLSLPSRFGRMIGRLSSSSVRPSLEAATSRMLSEPTLLKKESPDVAT
ncbi:MAG: ABC transporter permease subunit [Pirellulaceae bacterium]|nr:ABC transporter permease subunit [Pirellulaceae bacterium]